MTTTDANLSMTSNVTSYRAYKCSFKKGKDCFEFTMPTFVIGVGAVYMEGGRS